MRTPDTTHLDYLKLLRESRRVDPAQHQQRLKIALLSDADTQHLVPLLVALFSRNGVGADIYAAEFDTIDLEVFDAESGLYRHKPDVVVLLHSLNAFRLQYDRARGDGAALAASRADHMASLWDTLKSRLSATIIQSNLPMPYERHFGSFDQHVPDTPLASVRALNQRIAELSRARAGVLVADIEGLANYVGLGRWYDEKLWALSKSFCALEHLPRVAQTIVDIALATLGRITKCVVLDLDNTLWGGVIGDDGLSGIQLGHVGDGEHFLRLQHYLLALRRRGILLAVCSKNQEDAARAPFRNHPEMVLTEDDIAVFVANWDSKVDNIKKIQAALNIGFDSLVFLDDNPFERNMVRQYLPDVIVPDLPEDPADYVRAVCELNLFESVSFTEEDRQRANLYSEEARRRTLEPQFTNVQDYLRALDMRAHVARFDAFHLPRIAQLIQRSNQFNLTTRRYAIAECEAMMNDHDGCEPLYMNLRDQFGDHGLIAAIVLRPDQTTLRIDLWLMSCRVLARGVEEYAMNHVVDLARQRGLTVVGEYIPTAKNAMVKEFYPRFGFTPLGTSADGTTTWVLDPRDYTPRETMITADETEPSR